MLDFHDLTALLAKQLDLDLSGATPESTLRDDLGLDSLAMAELLVLLDDHDVHLPDELIGELRTLADVHHYLTVLQPRIGSASEAVAP